MHSDRCIVPGDSGAWIYNPKTSELCGHVLAWGNKSQAAYIAPMEVLFEDIRRALDAERVCLPAVTMQAEVDRGQAIEMAQKPPRSVAHSSRQLTQHASDIDGGSVPAVPDQTLSPRSEVSSTNLNQQLEASKEVELALKDMKLGGEASAGRQTKVRARNVLKKDVPSPFQRAY